MLSFESSTGCAAAIEMSWRGSSATLARLEVLPMTMTFSLSWRRSPSIAPVLRVSRSS
jgi:hypothetical protein